MYDIIIKCAQPEREARARSALWLPCAAPRRARPDDKCPIPRKPLPYPQNEYTDQNNQFFRPNFGHCMNDSLDAINDFDSSHITVIRLRDQDIQNDLRQLQVQTFLGNPISKFDTDGLQVLDANNIGTILIKCLQKQIIAHSYVVIE